MNKSAKGCLSTAAKAIVIILGALMTLVGMLSVSGDMTRSSSSWE